MKTTAYFDNIHTRIINKLSRAKHNITIAVACFTDPDIFDVLCRKASEGVSVKLAILDDEINDNGGLDFKRLEECGGDVFVISKNESGNSKFENIMHHKFCVVDQRIVITGSYNWTFRARDNNENVVMISTASVVRQFLDNFDQILVSNGFSPRLGSSRKAAEEGDATAQNDLGCMYRDGKGVKRDFAEAVKWYRKAAEEGDATAQYDLGCIYRDGQGVKRDFAEQVKWFHKAAEQGHATASVNLGNMHRKGEGVNQNYAEAVKWYRKAAEQGHADAQNILGVLYYYGHGIQRDHREAEELWRKAAEQGNDNAKYNLSWWSWGEKRF